MSSQTILIVDDDESVQVSLALLSNAELHFWSSMYSHLNKPSSIAKLRSLFSMLRFSSLAKSQSSPSIFPLGAMLLRAFLPRRHMLRPSTSHRRRCRISIPIDCSAEMKPWLHDNGRVVTCAQPPNGARELTTEQAV